jgi:hypothetical protein
MEKIKQINKIGGLDCLLCLLQARSIINKFDSENITLLPGEEELLTLFLEEEEELLPLSLLQEKVKKCY